MSAQEQTVIAQIAEGVGLPGSGASQNVLTMVKAGQEAVDCLTSLGWEWTVDQGWNEKQEEVSKSTSIEIFEDLRREEIAQLEAENHRLRDEFQKTLKTSARLEEVGKLREENKKLKDFTNWENHPALKHKVVLDDDFYLQHLHEGELIDPDDLKKNDDQIKKLQETVAEQATDLFFMKCENFAGGDRVRDDIGHGAEWAGEVKDTIQRLWHQCPVNDVDEKEMFKRYLEWSNIYLSDVESDEDE